MAAKYRGDLGPSAKWLHSNIVYIALAVIFAYDIFRVATHILGPTPLSEDFAYVLLAIDALHGNISLFSLSIDGTRLLQYLPIAAFYRLFGVNIYTSSAWNAIMFLGTVLTAFFVGKRVYSSHAGLLAALLISFFTPAVKNSISVGISETMMFFVSVTLLALLYAHDKKSPKLMLVVGVLAIAAPLSIPIGLIGLLVVLVYTAVEFLRRRIDIRMVAWLAAGVVIVGLLVLVFSYINTGDPLAIVHENSVYYSNLTMAQTNYGIIGSAPNLSAYGSQNSVRSYLLFYPQQMFTYHIISAIEGSIATGNYNPVSVWNSVYRRYVGNSGFYFYAVFIAALALLVLRERNAYFPLLWFGVGFAFLEFAPMGISLFPFRYILSFRALRYTASVAVPIAVILAIAIIRIVEGKRHSRAAARSARTRRMARPSHYYARLLIGSSIVVFLIATSIPINNVWYAVVYAQTYPIHKIANYIESIGNSTPLYVPSAEFSYLEVYMYQHNLSRVVIYDNIYNCTSMPGGSYVVIPNTTLGWDAQLPYVNNTAEYCPNWQLIETIHASPGIVALSGWPQGRYAQKLYYVP